MSEREQPSQGPALVSVIIPNYNYAATLKLCIPAVLRQTHPNLEVIMVDDGSTDDSVAIAESHGVRVVHTGGRCGVAAGRNLGAAHARGQVLFFLDSDVELADDAVAQAAARLGADPGIGALCGIEDPEPLIRDSLVEEYRALQYHYWERSAEGDITYLCPAMLAIPAHVFADVGPFNTRLRHTEEVDYGQRVSERYRVVLTGAVHGRHDHDASLRLLLRKLFDRGRMRIPLYARTRKFDRGYEKARRVWASLLAGLCLAALPAAALGPWWLALPAALAAASIACDVGMYRFVLRRRGLPFTLYFTAMHYVVNVTIAFAAGVGLLNWLSSRSFRGIYTQDAVQADSAQATT
jgi:glycosyltransferase involved in cell wall biosynthesis